MDRLRGAKAKHTDAAVRRMLLEDPSMVECPDCRAIVEKVDAEARDYTGVTEKGASRRRHDAARLHARAMGNHP
jgi:hypothetical protein